MENCGTGGRPGEASGGPLPERGAYGAHIACSLYCGAENAFVAANAYMAISFPKITQDGRVGDAEPGYVANLAAFELE